MPFCSECGCKTELQWRCCPMCTTPLQHTKTHSNGTAKVHNPYGSASTVTMNPVPPGPPPMHNPYGSASTVGPPQQGYPPMNAINNNPYPPSMPVPGPPTVSATSYHQPIPPQPVNPINPYNQMVQGLAQGINQIVQGTTTSMMNPYPNQMTQSQKVQKEWLIKDCVRCQGKGRSNFGEQCKGCKGIGSIVVSNAMTCGGCSGNGRTTFDVCRKCDGTGFRNVISDAKFPSDFYVKAECRSCDGDGKTSWGNKCAVCYGAGDVLVLEDKVQCASCNNKGKTSFGEKCRVCKGCGWGFVFEG